MNRKVIKIELLILKFIRYLYCWYLRHSFISYEIYWQINWWEYSSVVECTSTSLIVPTPGSIPGVDNFFMNDTWLYIILLLRCVFNRHPVITMLPARSYPGDFVKRLTSDRKVAGSRSLVAKGMTSNDGMESRTLEMKLRRCAIKIVVSVITWMVRWRTNM